MAPSRCRIVIFCGLLSTAMAVTAAADPAAQGVAPNSGEAAANVAGLRGTLDVALADISTTECAVDGP